MDTQRILAELKSEHDRLARAISALEGTDKVRRRGRRPMAAVASEGPVRRRRRRRRRRLTAEGRRRLSEMMKKRWAERKKKGL